MRNRKGILSLFFIIFMLILVSCGPATKKAVTPPLPDTTTYVYTGNPITYNVERSTLYSVSNTTQTNAGTYDVVLTLRDKNNYAWVTTSSSDDLVYKFIISPMAIEKPTVEAKTYPYTGSEITFDIPTSSYYSISNNKATDAGTYTATVSLSDKNNLVWADGTKDDLTFNFSIVNVDLSYATISNVNNEYVYTGQEIKPIPTVKFGNDTLVLNQDYNLTYQNNINVGQAKVIITGIGNFNGSKTINYNIVKADPTIVAPTAKTLTYNGQAQELINPGTTSGGTFEYKLEGGSYSSAIPQATNAGTYKVYYKVVGNSNYKDSAERSIDVTIAKANYDLSNIKFENKTYTYDGLEKELTITGNLPSGVTVTYETNKLTNAGSVVAKAKFSGDTLNYNPISDMTATLTISKAIYDMSAVKFENTSYTYDGTEKTILISGNLPEGVTVAYENNKLTNAGEIIATAKFSGDENHEAIPSMSATLTIDKANFDMSGIKFEDSAYTYDGLEKEIVITGTLPEGVTVSYINNKLTNAGNVTATAKFSHDNQNYNNIADMTAVLTINKAESSVGTNPVGVNNLVYTGEELELVTAGTAVGGTLEYKVGGTDYSASLPKATNAGKYTIYFRVKGDNNHNDSEASSIEVKIGKATYDMSAVKFNDLELTYNTKEQKIEITGELPEGVTVSYENNTLTNVGSTLATAKFNVDDNHNEISDMQATLTIVKADPVITAPTAKELTYTGEALELINEASTTGGKVVYKLEGEENYSEELPKGTNAGEYKVFYKVAGDNNYNDTLEQSLTITIKKADPIITKEPIAYKDEMVYNGSSYKLLQGGEAIGGTIWFGSWDETWQKYNNFCQGSIGQVYAGTWKRCYYVEGDSNHNDSDFVEFVFIIKKATYDMSGVAFDNATYKYTGDKFEIRITGTLPDDVSVEYENNTLTNVGSTLATAKFSGDYNNYNEIADMKATLTITKADSSITKAPAAITNLVYNTKAQDLITKGETSSGTLMYKLEGGEYSTSIPQATNHGTYNVWYKVVGDENHEDLEEALIEGITIAKATPTVTAPKAIENLVYTGKALDIATAGSTNGGEMVYSLDDMNFVSYIPKVTDAGTHKLYYLVCENANYLSVDSTFIEIEIAKATYDMSAVTFADKTETYTGQEITITITGTLPEGVTVSYTNNALTNVGSTLATAKFSGNANYEAIADMTATLTINKAQVAKPTEVSFDVTYDGTEKTYALAESNLYTITNNKATNAGTYKAKVTLNDKNNYEWDDSTSDDLEYEFIIKKATYDMSAVSFADKTVTYDGTEKSITITGTLPTDVTVAYTNNTLTNVGSILATAKFSGDSSNYEAIADMTATLTINKGQVAKPTEVSFDVTYDGTEKTYALAESDLYTITNNKATNAGTYKAKVALNDKDNYEWNDSTSDDLEYEFVIEQANISSATLANEIEDQVYTGSAITPAFELIFNNATLDDENYDVEYSNNINAGTATITVTGLGNFKGTKVITFKIISYITYNITYITNGGSAVTTRLTYTSVENEVAIELPTTTKNGYTFAGWTGIGDNVTIYTSIPANTMADLELTAAYNVITYSISYDLADGSVSEANPTEYNIETATFTLNNPTKEHYVFTGWTGSNGDTPQKTVSISLGSYGDKSYTANWTPKSYSITYNLNGGAVASANPATYTIETATFTLNNPTRTGYTFAGWTGSNGDTASLTVSVNLGTTGNLTFNANWTTITYNISYDYNGGAVATANPATYNIETNTFTLIEPELLGYTFIGWTGSNGDTPQKNLSVTKGSYGHKSFTANWELTNYHIYYWLVGGTNNPNNPETYTMLTNDFQLLAPTKDGWEFNGWSTTDNASTGEMNVTITKGTTGDLTYYAVWATLPYNIAYDLAGGSLPAGKTNPTEYRISDPTFTLNNPARDGYTFTGWTGSNGSTPSTTVTIEMNSTGDKTYTANWAPIQYTITFDTNGGTPSSIDNITYDIEDETFTLPTVTKEGYDFIAWYKGGTGMTQVTTGTHENLDLRAEWKAINYTITYTLNGGTNHASNPSTYIITDSFTLLAPTRDGYDFTGWTGDSTTINAGTTGDLAYTAGWSIHEYTISYSLDGGSVATANPTTYTIETDTFTLNNPTKTGYDFMGWNDGTTTSPTITITKGSSFVDKSYTAIWKIKDYSITYTLNDGTNSVNNPTSYNIESSTTVLEMATKTGYTFVNWTLAGNPISEFNPSEHLDVVSGVTIVATFIECPFVISTSSHGTFRVYENQTELETITIGGYKTLKNSYVGQTIKFVAETTEPNYVYNGIHSASIDTPDTKTKVETSFNYSTSISNTAARTIISPDWYEFNITIECYYSEDSEPTTGISKPTWTGVLVDGETITYTATIPEDLIWDGWYDSHNTLLGNRSLVLSPTLSSTSQTFNAKWYQRSSLINYSTTGGVGTACISLSDNLIIGEEITLTANSVENFAFIGWFNSSDEPIGTENYIEVQLTTSLQEFTAKYVKDTITVERYYYNLQNTATIASDTNQYGGTYSKVQGATQTTITFTNYTGFTLTTFRLKTTQDNVTVNNGQAIVDNSDVDIIYEAIWSPITYNITYNNLNGATNNNPTTYTILSGTFYIEELEDNNGQAFKGWTSDTITTPEKSVEINSQQLHDDLSFTANWEGAKVTIRFYDNAGAYIEDEYEVGSPIEYIPTRDEYTFEAWYRDKDFENLVTNIPNSNTSLYACWQEETKPEYFTIVDNVITGLAKTPGDTIRFPRYYGGQPITIDMNYDWSSYDYDPLEVGTPIIFGYYQTNITTEDEIIEAYENGLFSEIYTAYYNYDSDSDGIDELYYVDDDDNIYTCDSIKWTIVEQTNSGYKLICNSIIDASNYSNLSSKLSSINELLSAVSGQAIVSSNPSFSIASAYSSVEITNYSISLGCSSVNYFLSDTNIFATFTYYVNNTSASGSDNSIHGIRPVITVSF